MPSRRSTPPTPKRHRRPGLLDVLPSSSIRPCLPACPPLNWSSVTAPSSCLAGHSHLAEYIYSGRTLERVAKTLLSDAATPEAVSSEWVFSFPFLFSLCQLGLKALHRLCTHPFPFPLSSLMLLLVFLQQTSPLPFHHETFFSYSSFVFHIFLSLSLSFCFLFLFLFLFLLFVYFLVLFYFSSLHPPSIFVLHLHFPPISRVPIFTLLWSFFCPRRRFPCVLIEKTLP